MAERAIERGLQAVVPANTQWNYQYAIEYFEVRRDAEAPAIGDTIVRKLSDYCASSGE